VAENPAKRAAEGALIFLTEHVLWFAMSVAGIGLFISLEDHFKWPALLAYATTSAVTFAIGIPWWRWPYPAIERAILRASHGALRAGVAVFAIAVTVSVAGGDWSTSTLSDLEDGLIVVSPPTGQAPPRAFF